MNWFVPIFVLLCHANCFIGGSRLFDKPTSKPKAVYNYPCSKHKTAVDIVVLSPDGQGYKNAVIYYVDDNGLFKCVTKEKGTARVLVTGCSISMIITGKDIQPTHKSHSFHKSKKPGGLEKVIVQVSKKCNFKVYFYSSTDGPTGKSLDVETAEDWARSSYPQYEVVNYILSGGDGSFSTDNVIDSGTAVAGDSGVCISTANTGLGSNGGFRLIARDATGMSNELAFLELGLHWHSAAIAIPPPLHDVDYEFLICFNIWQRGAADYGLLSVNTIKRISYPDVDLTWYPRGDYCITIDYFDQNLNNLICFGFEDPGRPRLIDGAISIRDKNGHFYSVRMPERAYRNDVDGRERVLRAFCICPGQKKHLVPINDRSFRTFITEDDSLTEGQIGRRNRNRQDPEDCDFICNEANLPPRHFLRVELQEIPGETDEKPVGNDANDGFDESSTVDDADNSTDDFNESSTDIFDDNLSGDFDTNSIDDHIDEEYLEDGNASLESDEAYNNDEDMYYDYQEWNSDGF